MPEVSLPARPFRTGGARRLVAVAAVVVAVVAGGCGAGDGGADGPDGPDTDGPRVADPRFDGNFEIVAVVVDGSEVGLAQRPAIDIEAEFGGLTVLPGCNTYFGSFTLDDEGPASFTVTGGSDADCGPLADQEEAVLAALAAVDRWTATEAGFRFDGAGSAVTVVGPAS